jgi:hypothetical protein
MNAWRWLREARKAARELRAQGRTIPFAEAFFMDPATRRLLVALSELGIVDREDLREGGVAAPIVHYRSAA